MKNSFEREQEKRAIRAAKLGRPEGFQTLYELNRTYVYSVCLRMTHEPALAEDLTQDIFVQVLRKISSFKGDARFRTWLHRVTVNMVLIHFRRHKNLNVSLDDETMPATEIIMAGQHPHSDPDTDIAIRKLLAELPPKHQSVLRLHDIEGYRHQDISRLLGITAGASRSQLHKIRIKLRIGLGLDPHKPRLQCVKLKLAEAA
jgi:RNA polymerase sigma-70 factor, ECF subfamily